MSFDWTNEAEREAPAQAPKLPPGQHHVTVSKIIFAAKNGEAFMTKNGDQQIMVIVADAQGREASRNFCCSDKHGWALAKLCAACGLNLDKMSKAGVTPGSFTAENFARKNLEGRKLLVEVYYDKDYANFNPLRASGNGNVSKPAAKASAPAAKETVPPDLDEDIPF